MASKGLKNPFETGVSDEGDKVVVLPSNFEELCHQHYLFILYGIVLQQQRYHTIPVEKKITLRHKPDDSMTVYLKAFGIIVSTGQIPELPKSKGQVWKGVASAVLLWLQGQPKLDVSLTKISQAPHPAKVLFDDIWGANYPVEKKILDHIIHYIRSLKIGDESNLRSFVLPEEQLISDKGLNLDLESELILGPEKLLITNYLSRNGSAPTYKLVHPETLNLPGLVDLQVTIAQRQKALKSCKDAVKTTVSNRITSCYNPYKGNKRNQARKLPIGQLITAIKGTADYHAFNPTVLFPLVGVASLPFEKPPGFSSDQMVALSEKVLHQLTGVHVPEDIAASLSAGYLQYLSEYNS